MKDSLDEKYVSIVKLMNSLDEEYDELSEKRLIVANQKEKVAKICPHDVVLRSKIYELHIHCLCCNKSAVDIKPDTMIIDMDEKFGDYLMTLNYNYYNVIYRDVCNHMSKYFKNLVSDYKEDMDIEAMLNEELESFSKNYLSGRKLK